MTTIGSLGLAQSATYHAARSARLGSLTGSTLVIVAIDSLALVTIGWLILPVVLGGHDLSVVHEGQLFLSAYIPLLLTSIAMMSILNGSHRFVWFQSLRLLQFVVVVSVITTLALTDSLTTANGAAAYVAGAAVTAAISFTVVLRASWKQLSVSGERIREILGFGLKSQLSTSMWSLNERADQLVISIFFSATSLGLYVVAVTLTSLTTLVGFHLRWWHCRLSRGSKR